MNNKGFMMAELIVVSAIIIITLTTFFTSYSRLITSYNKNVNYYDVGNVYRLKHYINEIDLVSEVGNLETYRVIKDTNQNTYNSVKYEDNVYLVKGDYNINNITNEHTTFKEYAQYFSNSVKIETPYFLLLESCQTKNEKTQCKYSYMEVTND